MRSTKVDNWKFWGLIINFRNLHQNKTLWIENDEGQTKKKSRKMTYFTILEGRGRNEIRVRRTNWKIWKLRTKKYLQPQLCKPHHTHGHICSPFAVGRHSRSVWLGRFYPFFFVFNILYYSWKLLFDILYSIHDLNSLKFHGPTLEYPLW